MGCYAKSFGRSLPLWRRVGASLIRRASSGLRVVAPAGRGSVLRTIADRVEERCLGSGPPQAWGGTAGWASPGWESQDGDPVVSVIGSLAPGGAERQLVVHAEASSRRGLARHHVVTLRPCEGMHGHLLARAEASGITVETMGASCDPSAAAVLRDDRSLRQRLRSVPSVLRSSVADLAGEFLRRRPRVVHAWLDHANVPAGIAALLVGAPRVVLSLRSVHPGNFPALHRPWMRPWYQLLLTDARVRLLANSRPGARSYASWLGVDADRVMVVPNAVDPESLRPPCPDQVAAIRAELGLRPGQKLVCGVLRLSEEKQPQVFMEVARSVCHRRSDTQFALVGDGPMRGEAEASASRLGSRVAVLGARSDAAAIMAASDLVLLTSRMEGTPNVLLEAQALGVPVVATRVGGVEDAVLDGETGCLREWNDPAGLAEAVSSLLADDSRRRAWGEHGAAWVRRRFSVEAMVAATNAIYEGSR